MYVAHQNVITVAFILTPMMVFTYRYRHYDITPKIKNSILAGTLGEAFHMGLLVLLTAMAPAITPKVVFPSQIVIVGFISIICACHQWNKMWKTD